MSIHMLRNQYRGVNAHLHSHFQRRGGWAEFHRAHMNDLLEELQSVLWPDTGYTVRLERSIQPVHNDMFPDKSTASHPEYKVEVDEYAFSTDRDLSRLPLQPVEPKLILPVTSLFTEDEDLMSVVILRGEQLITRIELLSPASKPPGSHYSQYLFRRTRTLLSQINLVEIDYLHERRSPVLEVPDYTKHEPGSYPYSIMVSHLASPTGPGHTEVYAFWVEEPIPVIAIPLAGDDVVTFDFGAAYHKTFAANNLNGLRIVDYAKLPEGIESYSENDRQRIHMRIRLVKTMKGIADDDDAE